MSRIGKLPVNLPAGVTVTVSPDNVVSVKGPLGTLSQKVDSDIKVEVGTHTEVHTGKEVPAVLVSRPTNQPRHRSLHGLYRALINNMVVGVSKGYEIKQELVGVGFKAEVKGNILEMSLGYSHDTYLMLPPEVTATAVTEKKGNPIVTLKSIDKQLIGQVAAKIRSLRKPEPYKGKGIKFVGEVLRRNKIERRERIKMRIRKIVSGTQAQPRMTVYRSNKQIYVQFIDDLAGTTLAAASSLDKEVAEAAAGKNKCEVAALVGKLAAQRAVEKGISTVAFDRNGYLYHGRVKVLADAAREGGLKF